MLSAFLASAQIPAPALICVSNDTLVWEPPTVTCGLISGYRIYGSADNTNNFQEIANINDPGRQTFFHQDAGGTLWYYYLETVADCPGQAPLSSDTLDNRIPVIAPLSYVSVLSDSEVEIAWKPSPSPEVYAYIVLKNTPSGTRAVDTVFVGNTYIDIDENIQSNPVEYFVLAMDRCGNTSLFDASQQTVFLRSGDISNCEQTIALEWTAYENWQGGVEKYEIWYSENGGTPQLSGNAAGDELTYVFENANDQTEYCFFVKAIESGTGIAASSNAVCLTTDIVQPNRLLIAKNATYNASGQIELSWIWNPDAELREVAIERAAEGAAFSAISTSTPTLPLAPAVSYTDNEAAGFSGPVGYLLRTWDVCDTEKESNVVNTLFLEGLASTDGQNSLNWNVYSHAYGKIESIEVIRETASGSQTLTVLSGNATAYTDIVDPNNPDLSTACYNLLAELVLDIPDTGTEVLELRSNTLCLDQTPGIYIPNVFAPKGDNNTEFKPFFQFGTPMDYHLMIFDRYGGMVFESKDPSLGWQGTQRGEELGQGTYVYVLQLTLSNGTPVRKEGSVLLLR